MFLDPSVYDSKCEPDVQQLPHHLNIIKMSL